MEIIIAGDLVPTESNINSFKCGDMLDLLGDDFLTLWNSADFRIFNLEVPLTDTKSPIDKCGPNLIAPLETIKGIKGLKPNLVTLANNHIMDQGEQGLLSTQEALDANSISYVGVGKNLNEACKPYLIEKDGVRVGVYACTEHEFSIATEYTPGANPFDPLESLDHINELKRYCDYVIVLYHGGKEHYRYPSPYLQKVCRKMVQKGADLVVCQHSHCIGCYESYKGSTIIYGQGNFIFDHLENEYWKTSMLIKLTLGEQCSVDFIPLIREKNGVRLAKDDTKNKILESFYHRSNQIKERMFIEQNYNEFAKGNIMSYLANISGFCKLLIRIDRKLSGGKILEYSYSKERLLALQNFIECEAHRELFLRGIVQRRNLLAKEKTTTKQINRKS